jgi:dihydrolipoamide dehydrogenase
MGKGTRKVDIAIIGAGSAGLSALRQVRAATDNYVLIDPGPLGTTCARIGCMPSKALLHAAGIYHQRQRFPEMGIYGSEGLSCTIRDVLQFVRDIRDRFTGAMIDETIKLAGEGRLIEKQAKFIGPQELMAGPYRIAAEKIIIATGARPMMPSSWRAFEDRVLTTETIFEQSDLPGRIAVIGLGPVGLELGQALSRLGIEVIGCSHSRLIGGIESKDMNAVALEIFGSVFPIYTGKETDIEKDENGLAVRIGDHVFHVDAVLAATGVQPNLDNLDIEKLGLELDEQGMVPVDPHSGRIAGLPIYLAGDVNGCRPILHEALDEGFLAGYRAVRTEDVEPFCRRVPMRLVFTDPQIAVVGNIASNDNRLASAYLSFKDQSRAIIEGRNRGRLEVYAERESGRVSGAEMVSPDAEHLAHLIALAVQQGMAVYDMLNMPFYHPTVEEGLRTVLRDLAQQLSRSDPPAELLHGMQCAPEKPLC